MFERIKVHLQTKTIVNGKLKQPVDLSQELLSELLENPKKLEETLEILKSSRGNLIEKKILACMKKFVLYLVFVDGIETIHGFTKRIAQGIISGELSLLLCSFLPLAELDLKELGFNNDSKIQNLLALLLEDSKYHHQYCELVSKFDLYHLIDSRLAILFLLGDNEANLLAIFLSTPQSTALFLGIIQDRAKEYLAPQNFDARNSSMNQFAKVVKTTLRLIDRLDVLETSHELYTVCTLPELCWALQSIKRLEKEEDCNPNYDVKEIQRSYFDKIPFLIKTNNFLENVVKEQLEYYNLDFLDTPDIGIVLDLTIKPSLEYYNPKSPISLVNSKTPLNLNPNLISLISLDCEWTNETPLATTQLCIDFKDGTRSNLILDMLNPPLDLGYTFSQLFAQNHWIGFESSQDFIKIHSLYPSLPHLPTRYTNLAVHPALADLKVKSLSKVSLSVLGLRLDKRPRMSHWNRRPLRRCQVLYAAADAEILLEIYKKLMRMVV